MGLKAFHAALSLMSAVDGMCNWEVSAARLIERSRYVPMATPMAGATGIMCCINDQRLYNNTSSPM